MLVYDFDDDTGSLPEDVLRRILDAVHSSGFPSEEPPTLRESIKKEWDW